MKKLILHIPHSSSFIPSKEGFLLDDQNIEKEILKITDWHTDDLFSSEEDDMIVAPFSRIFSDPERFTDDAQEVMAQYGMGVLYEKTDDGKPMRKVSPELKEKILEKFYWSHHKKLEAAVQQQLDGHGQALILDCHSYPSIPFTRDLDQTPERPDFNIGTDPFHTPPELIALSREFFESRGYSLGVNWPYKGALVPLTYYGKDKRVHSLMLEINRNLYLQEPSNERSKRYNETKLVVQQFLTQLRRFS